MSHLQQPAGASGHSRALGEDTVAVGGQVVALSDEYDRLVHGHAPRARLAREDALASLAATRDRWHADVHDALVRITAGGPA